MSTKKCKVETSGGNHIALPTAWSRTPWGSPVTRRKMYINTIPNVQKDEILNFDSLFQQKEDLRFIKYVLEVYQPMPEISEKPEYETAHVHKWY